MNNSGPIFPEFKILEISDKSSIEELTTQFPPYSDFNFISIWSYDTHNDVEFSWLNNNFVMKFRNYLTKEPFYSFIGVNQVNQTIKSLFELSRKQGFQKKLELIPEVVISAIENKDSQEFKIEESIDNHDYVISLSKTFELSNLNEHKIESYHKFIEQNPSHELRIIDITNEKIQKEMCDLFELWIDNKRGNPEDSRNEYNALKKLFKFSKNFNLVSQALYLDKKMIAYIIDERVQKPYIVGHFLKADTSYKGVYEVINRDSAKIHLDNGYNLINIEQDLGIEGLRISKKQRNPVEFLKKYTITKL